MGPYATEKEKKKIMNEVQSTPLLHWMREEKEMFLSTFKCFAKCVPPLSDPGHFFKSRISNNKTSNRTQTTSHKPEKVILPTN